MTTVQEATPPTEPLYPRGYLPNPLAWPPRQYCGGGRFDDPQGRFGTLYAAEQRRGCFMESLARYRPSPQALLQLRGVASASGPFPLPLVPGDWCVKRAIARFRPRPGQRWLDLQVLETREALRVDMAETLVRLGIADLDVASVRSLNRALTQAMAGWAYEHGYSGVAYSGRFDDGVDCWAVFEGAALEQANPTELILPSDPDFRETLRVFGLTVQ